MFNCPKCSKAIKTKKSLARHLAKQHPENPGDSPQESKNLKTEVLEIKAPPKKEKKESVFEGTQGRYHCIDCGKDIAKGQTPCPHCGAQLDWSKVE